MAYNKTKGTGITVKDYENINQALRRFKRKVEDAGTLDVLRSKEHYEKPTTARKRAKAAAVKRLAKKLSRENARRIKLY